MVAQTSDVEQDLVIVLCERDEAREVAAELAEVLVDKNCSQCGKAFSEPACGLTHSFVFVALQQTLPW